MDEMKRFSIEVRCSHREWWRYNVQLMCEELDAAGERVHFGTTSSVIAEVGANLKVAPAEVKVPSKISYTTEPCHTARLYLYILPHSLPTEREVDAVSPFKLTIKISCDGTVLRTEQPVVNPWGGLSLILPIGE